MASKNIFVSFDWDHDRHYKFLLEAWHANPEFDFLFSDQTPREIDSYDIGRIKAGLTGKIRSATYTLFIVGEHANDWHPKASSIGFRNWINFEAYQSCQEGNRLAVVKLNDSCAVPEKLSARYSRITGFTEKNVLAVINHAGQGNYANI